MCHDDSAKRRANPLNPQVTLRICLECENKYIGKKIYDEFLYKRKDFDVKMEQLRFQYDLFDEGLKNMQKNVYNMDFEVIYIIYTYILIYNR